MKKKLWVYPETKEVNYQSLARDLSISPILSQILVNRGFSDPQQIQDFLNPSLDQLFHPFEIPGMQKACERIFLAMQNKEKICIYGDYDVDGCCSTALLCDFFNQIQVPVEYYIPDRLKEGYSLNRSAIDQLKADGTDLIITVDNAIRANEVALYLSRLNMDLIITDHHELGEEIPEAHAVVNPKLDHQSPGQELAGVGVAFFLCIGLRLLLRERGYFKERAEPRLRDFLDLVALATIADLVPLTGVNRVLTKLGLSEMSQRKRLGLRVLLEISEASERVSAYDCGFRLGPRINAAGRLSQVDKGLALLLCQDKSQAYPLAFELDQENRQRREIEKNILEKIKVKIFADPSLLDKRSLLFYDASFHVGVVGIVASRLVEEYYLPSIVFCEEEGGVLRGSARSISGLNLIEILDRCSQYLDKYGGHKMAAGMTLQKKNFENFAEAFDVEVKKQLPHEEDFIPRLRIDSSLQFEQINSQLLDELSLLEPFGMANAQPNLLLNEVQFCDLRKVGEKHLKGNLSYFGKKMDFIWFNHAERCDDLSLCNHAVFYPEFNFWQGRRNLQLKIKDIL